MRGAHASWGCVPGFTVSQLRPRLRSGVNNLTSETAEFCMRLPSASALPTPPACAFACGAGPGGALGRRSRSNAMPACLFALPCAQASSPV